MTDLFDRKLRQLVQEIADAAPELSGPTPRVDTVLGEVVELAAIRHRRRNILAAAAAIVVLGLGVWGLSRPGNDTVVDDPAAAEQRFLADVDALADGEWVIPSYLPESLADASPVIMSDGFSRTIFYTSPTDPWADFFISISSEDPFLETGESSPQDPEVEIAGLRWGDFGNGFRRAFGQAETAPIVIVEAQTLVRSELLRIMEGLVVVASEGLPARPVDLTAEHVVVAEASLAGRPVELAVTGSSQGFSVETFLDDGSGGSMCCPGLPEWRFAALMGATSYSVPGITIEGVVAEEVAALDIEFVNGETRRVVPQNIVGEFGVKFFLLPIDGETELEIEGFRVVEFTSYDFDGDVLAVESVKLRRPEGPSFRAEVDEAASPNTWDLEADEWLYPAYLPDRLAALEPVASISDGFRTVVIFDERVPIDLRIVLAPADHELDPEAPRTAIAARSWVDHGNLLQTEVGTADTGEALVLMMESLTLPRAELETVIESLEVVATAGLPLQVIDMNAEPVLVAEAQLDGQTVSLLVTGAERTYSLGPAFAPGQGGSVCCPTLREGELFVVGGLTISPAGWTIDGIVDEQVAAIEVHFSDGSVRSVVPQDIGDNFPVNFFFLAVDDRPNPQLLSDAVEEFVLLDSAGEVLETVNP